MAGCAAPILDGATPRLRSACLCALPAHAWGARSHAVLARFWGTVASRLVRMVRGGATGTVALRLVRVVRGGATGTVALRLVRMVRGGATGTVASRLVRVVRGGAAGTVASRLVRLWCVRLGAGPTALGWELVPWLLVARFDGCVWLQTILGQRLAGLLRTRGCHRRCRNPLGCCAVCARFGASWGLLLWFCDDDDFVVGVDVEVAGFE